MKAGIHPEYVPCKVHCACGVTFETRSSLPQMRVDVCNSCHPFYTGAQKFLDTAGRVDRFRKRYAKADAVAETPGGAKAESKAESKADAKADKKGAAKS